MTPTISCPSRRMAPRPSFLLAALAVLCHGVTLAPAAWAQTSTARRPMPTPRTELAVAEVSGFLYAVGGMDSNSWYVGTVEAYDATTDRWAIRAPMPTPRAGFGIGVVNGVIYAVGGETWGAAAITAVEAYDPNTNTWTTKAPMPSPRARLSVAVVDGILYALGGVKPNGERVASVEAYDPIANSWSTQSTATTNQSQSAAGAVSGVSVTINTTGIETLPVDAASLEALSASEAAVAGRTGFALDAPFIPVPTDEIGTRHVQLPELGRLELRFPWPVDAAYLVANGTLRDMPWGSRLDPATGTFTWALGAGYLGTYRLVFVTAGERIPVEVTVRTPKAAVPGESQIRMFVDLPRADQEVSGPITVAGWALDPQADIASGIEYVHVWARRTDVPATQSLFLGAAELGGTRTDVGRVFGRQFDRAGYGLTASPLAPGHYQITVFAWNRRTARWEDARTVNIVAR